MSKPLHPHPPPCPPPGGPPPYYLPPPPRRPPKPRHTALASCIVATIFLVFVAILLCILYFSLLEPKDPTIAVTAVQLPTFSLSAANSTAPAAASFTFTLYAAVRNPNRAAFSHYDSSLRLLYAGAPVGSEFVPAGEIAAGRTEYVAADFSVRSFPVGPPSSSVAASVTDGVDRVRPTIELEARLEMVGRVRVLRLFSHHVGAVADCTVAVAITDGTVLGFHC